MLEENTESSREVGRNSKHSLFFLVCHRRCSDGFGGLRAFPAQLPLHPPKIEKKNHLQTTMVTTFLSLNHSNPRLRKKKPSVLLSPEVSAARCFFS